jgi:putative proteasome-type protease
MTRDGLVMMSDSRTNAGFDQATQARKMFTFVQQGERVFILLTSGNLALAQSVITLIRQDFNEGRGIGAADSLYAASRSVGEQIRRVSALDGPALRKDSMKFNVNILLGGQVRGERPGLCMIYPQGNPLAASKETCYLQIGECKYGKPILDRGISYQETSLEEAAKYALLSMDATIRSNVTVGPPIDISIYRMDTFDITEQRRFKEADPDLSSIHSNWETALRRAVADLPSIDFSNSIPDFYRPKPKNYVPQQDLDLTPTLQAGHPDVED